jgi:TonB family protein
VDATSIHVADRLGRVWWKFVPKAHTVKGPDGKRWIAYGVIRSEFDCSDETVTYEAMKVYFDDKTDLTAGPGELASYMYKPVEPDSTDDVMMKYVCAWKPTSQADSPTSHTDDLPPPKAGAVVAATPIRIVRMPNCGEDYYPAQAIRLNQHGSVVVKFCVGTDNKIDGAVEIVTSSGFPLLDDAAGQCVGAGGYKAAIVNGLPARTCREMKVAFNPLEGR